MIRKQHSSFSNGFMCLFAAACLVAMLSSMALAQSSNTRERGTYYGGSVVGGVEVDADGVLRTAQKKTMDDVGRTLSKLLESVPSELNQPATVRKISLKKLDETMRTVIEKQEEFPDSIRYLGGLTAIHYIVAVPEQNDVLLVGPAEGWKVDNAGNVVGRSSGRPVLRLEDLVTVYRAWYMKDRPSVITCSIDPTQEALSRLAKLNGQFGVTMAQNAAAVAAAMEEAYGMNVVTIRGVPENSRYAKILAAADYKMKRIGLGHEPSLVRGLPSYTSMLSGGSQMSFPRFWFAPEYGTVTHDSKKLTWKLSEVKVKTLTEDEFVDSRSGSPKPSGRVDHAGVAWCKRMNENYDKLSKVDPVFADLKNCMELAIAVALIQREGLLEKADCKVPTLAEHAMLKPVPLPAPRYVPSRASVFKNGRAVGVICGGVEINPFTTLDNARLDNKIDKEHAALAKTVGNTWWSK